MATDGTHDPGPPPGPDDQARPEPAPEPDPEPAPEPDPEPAPAPQPEPMDPRQWTRADRTIRAYHTGGTIYSEIPLYTDEIIDAFVAVEPGRKPCDLALEIPRDQPFLDQLRDAEATGIERRRQREAEAYAKHQEAERKRRRRETEEAAARQAAEAADRRAAAIAELAAADAVAADPGWSETDRVLTLVTHNGRRRSAKSITIPAAVALFQRAFPGTTPAALETDDPLAADLAILIGRLEDRGRARRNPATTADELRAGDPTDRDIADLAGKLLDARAFAAVARDMAARKAAKAKAKAAVQAAQKRQRAAAAAAQAAQDKIDGDRRAAEFIARARAERVARDRALATARDRALAMLGTEAREMLAARMESTRAEARFLMQFEQLEATAQMAGIAVGQIVIVGAVVLTRTDDGWDIDAALVYPDPAVAGLTDANANGTIGANANPNANPNRPPATAD